MKIINPSFEILDYISPYGINELEKIERIGRVAYQSAGNIKDQAESAKPFISGLISRGHESVLEHCSLSVRFICDRGVSHELVRHRLASFTQESTRWCNYSKNKFGNELTFILPKEFESLDTEKLNEYLEHPNRVPDGFKASEKEGAYLWWYRFCRDSEYVYMLLVGDEFKLSPEYARSVLTNSIKTEIVVTANYREWRHILKLRTAADAHPEMRRLMVPLLKELQERLPVIFDDINPNC